MHTGPHVISNVGDLSPLYGGFLQRGLRWASAREDGTGATAAGAGEVGRGVKGAAKESPGRVVW